MAIQLSSIVRQSVAIAFKHRQSCYSLAHYLQPHVTQARHNGLLFDGDYSLMQANCQLRHCL